jgi:hypothetical protein
MPSAAEDIVTEIVTLLTVPALSAVPAASVYRDLMDARTSSHMPCVAVETGDEPAPVRSLIGVKDRRLEVEVTVLAKGASPYLQADAAVLEIANRLLNAPRADGMVLNGLALDVLEGPTRRQREGLSEDIAAVTKTYVIEYRTSEISIERWAGA